MWDLVDALTLPKKKVAENAKTRIFIPNSWFFHFDLTVLDSKSDCIGAPSAEESQHKSNFKAKVQVYGVLREIGYNN